MQKTDEPMNPGHPCNDTWTMKPWLSGVRGNKRPPWGLLFLRRLFLERDDRARMGR